MIKKENYGYHFGEKTLFLEFTNVIQKDSISNAIQEVREEFPNSIFEIVAYKNIIGYWAAYYIKSGYSIYCGTTSLKDTKEKINKSLNYEKKNNMKLKIVAISDLHGKLPEIIEPADIMLLVGDIMPLEIQFNRPKSKEWLHGEFADWIKKLPVDEVFMVAGNHDAYFESISQTLLLDFNNACMKLTYLKNEVGYYYDKHGQVWSIFGTPYCSIYGNWPFMRTDEYLTEKFKELPDKIDIIISHDPPFNSGDCDVILEAPDHRQNRMFMHLGNKPLGERIKDVDYKLLVCGHIHSGDHNFNEEFKTVNVSYFNEAYKPHYYPFYYELELNDK